MNAIKLIRSECNTYYGSTDIWGLTITLGDDLFYYVNVYPDGKMLDYRLATLRLNEAHDYVNYLRDKWMTEI